MSMPIVIAIVLGLSVPITAYIFKEKKRKEESRAVVASYLMEIQEEIDQLPFDKYLQKSWLHEHFIDEVLELYRLDKKVLKHLKV